MIMLPCHLLIGYHLVRVICGRICNIKQKPTGSVFDWAASIAKTCTFFFGNELRNKSLLIVTFIKIGLSSDVKRGR